MSSNRDIHSALVNWLSAELNVTVIKDHQGGDRPALPYLMVNFLNIREIREHPIQIDYEELDSVNSQGHKEVLAAPVLETEWEYSIHSYGEESTEILRALRSRVHLNQRLEPLFPALTVHEVGKINNVPDWINEAWETRANTKLFLHGLTRDGAVIDAIEDASTTVNRA